MLAALPLACSAPPPPVGADALPAVPDPPPILDTSRSLPAEPARTAEPASRLAPPCAADADCAYDPARDLCLVDPRANHQPPLVDQGLVCYCDGARCAALRVPPVPCESDASCAVRADPRPHPIASDAAHRHERGRPCRDFAFTTTCERTNICTMHRLRCPRP
jgi:hypothetical protein